MGWLRGSLAWFPGRWVFRFPDNRVEPPWCLGLHAPLGIGRWLDLSFVIPRRVLQCARNGCRAYAGCGAIDRLGVVDIGLPGDRIKTDILGEPARIGLEPVSKPVCSQRKERKSIMIPMYLLQAFVPSADISGEKK